MSHPIPTRTYQEDILEQWSSEELDKLFQLYLIECNNRGVKADISQFSVWLEDRL